MTLSYTVGHDVASTSSHTVGSLDSLTPIVRHLIYTIHFQLTTFSSFNLPQFVTTTFIIQFFLGLICHAIVVINVCACDGTHTKD